MVLSRFWLVIFISSITFIVFSLFSGDNYTIDHLLNGKKDDPILVAEKYLEQVPAFVKDSIQGAVTHCASIASAIRCCRPRR